MTDSELITADEEVLQDTVEEPEIGKWQWVAVYGEDDFLYQFDDDGKETPYGEIDREKLLEFHIIHADTRETLFAMALSAEQRLIYRRRVSLSGTTGEKRWEITLAGWQQTVKGVNVQSLNWVFPNGSIIQTGRFDDDHSLFYAPELLDFETKS